jgi:hypothetical protein
VAAILAVPFYKTIVNNTDYGRVASHRMAIQRGEIKTWSMIDSIVFIAIVVLAITAIAYIF